VRKAERESEREARVRRGVNVRRRMRRVWRRGKRGTRRERSPLKRVTVCVGTSWEKAMRKEICRGMVPLMEVRLYLRGKWLAGASRECERGLEREN
jgi:hypothetical protein